VDCTQIGPIEPVFEPLAAIDSMTWALKGPPSEAGTTLR
jgi:hypothetical protein